MDEYEGYCVSGIGFTGYYLTYDGEGLAYNASYLISNDSDELALNQLYSIFSPGGRFGDCRYDHIKWFRWRS
jgi:hypothetical protein